MQTSTTTVSTRRNMTQRLNGECHCRLPPLTITPPLAAAWHSLLYHVHHHVASTYTYCMSSISMSVTHTTHTHTRRQRHLTCTTSHYIYGPISVNLCPFVVMLMCIGSLHTGNDGENMLEWCMVMEGESRCMHVNSKNHTHFHHWPAPLTISFAVLRLLHVCTPSPHLSSAFENIYIHTSIYLAHTTLTSSPFCLSVKHCCIWG